MKKKFRDRTYQVLGVILLFTFTITAVSDFPFTGVIRTALGAVILGYVSGVRFKKPELNAEYPLAYLQYFWVTATVFCLWSLLAAMEVRLPTELLLGTFALFPIISLGVIWRKREYKVVSPYAFVQIAFFVAVLLEYVINA